MAEKQLIVVVEGTAALGPYWQTILSDYLAKIIRCFYVNELTGQNLSGEIPEFALVVFCAHGPYSANGPVVKQEAVSMGHPPAATVKMEPTILPSLGLGPAFSNMPPFSMVPSQDGLNSLAMTNSSTMNMPLTQHGPGFQQYQSKYIKIWEGAFSGRRLGQPVFICKLEGYRSTSASVTIAADWPESMHIVRLIAQDHMNNKQYVDKADYLVFRALTTHGFLGQLKERKLCAVVQLPSQTLLLSVSDKAGRLIGMLVPADMVVFKSLIDSLQQQLMNQQQQLMNQQQQ